MPKVKPTTIVFKGHIGKGRIVLGPMEGVEPANGLLIRYAMEPALKDVKGKWGKVVKQQTMNKVPIEAYPFDNVDKVDFGYASLAEYQKMVEAHKKKAEEEERAQKIREEYDRKQKEGLANINAECNGCDKPKCDCDGE